MEYARRQFLVMFSQSSACLLCSGAVASLLAGCGDESDPVSAIPVLDNPVIDLNAETSLQNIGGAVKKRISGINGGNVIIIVRTGDTTFVALSATCTHQGSEVGLPSNNVITCPNHGSQFNATDGNVVRGPAASPLPKFTTTYNADDNTVTIA